MSTEPKTLSDLGALKSEIPAAVAAAPVYTKKVDAKGRAYATGKRKNAIARVWLKPGAGKMTVNGKDYSEDCKVNEPLVLIEVGHEQSE